MASSSSSSWTSETKRGPTTQEPEIKEFKPAAVLNIIHYGTDCHRSQDNSHSILSLVHDNLARDANQSVHLLDGPGAQPETKKEVGQDNPALGNYEVECQYDPATGKIEVVKTPISGPNRASGLIAGAGTKQGRDEIVTVASKMIEAGKTPLQINLIGYSRGADNVRRAANALQAKFGKDLINISVFRFDDVPGKGNNRRTQSIIEPAIIDESFNILMAHEATIGFEPQDKSRTVVQDPKSTKVQYQIYAGVHSSALFMRPLDNKDAGFGPATPILARDDLLKFLARHHARFSSVSVGGLISKDRLSLPLLVANKNSPSKMEHWETLADIPSLTPEQRLDLYTVMRLTQFSEPGTRSFRNHLEEYMLHGTQFFINKEHQELFQHEYPNYFDFYFQKNINKTPRSQVIEDIKKIIGRPNHLATLNLGRLNLTINENINLANALGQSGFNVSVDSDKSKRATGMYFPAVDQVLTESTIPYQYKDKTNNFVLDELSFLIDMITSAANYVKRQNEDFQIGKRKTSVNEAIALKNNLQKELKKDPHEDKNYPIKLNSPDELRAYYIFRLKVLIFKTIDPNPSSKLTILLEAFLTPAEVFAMRCRYQLATLKKAFPTLEILCNDTDKEIIKKIISNQCSIEAVTAIMQNFSNNLKSPDRLRVRHNTESYINAANEMDAFLGKKSTYSQVSDFHGSVFEALKVFNTKKISVYKKTRLDPVVAIEISKFLSIFPKAEEVEFNQEPKIKNRIIEIKNAIIKESPTEMKMIYYWNLLKQRGLENNRALMSLLITDALHEAVQRNTDSIETKFIKALRKLQIKVSFHRGMSLDDKAQQFLAEYRNNFIFYDPKKTSLEIDHTISPSVSEGTPTTDSAIQQSMSFSSIEQPVEEKKSALLSFLEDDLTDDDSLFQLKTRDSTPEDKAFIAVLKKYAPVLGISVEKLKPNASKTEIITFLQRIYPIASAKAAGKPAEHFSHISAEVIVGEIFVKALPVVTPDTIRDYDLQYSKILTSLQNQFNYLDHINSIRGTILEYLKKNQLLYAAQSTSVKLFVPAPTPVKRPILSTKPPVIERADFKKTTHNALDSQMIADLAKAAIVKLQKDLQAPNPFYENVINIQFKLRRDVETILSNLEVILKEDKSAPIPKLTKENFLELNEDNRVLKELIPEAKILLKLYFILQMDNQDIHDKIHAADAYFSVAPTSTPSLRSSQ